jgi:cobalamin biosynthesis protein CobD/CbiB
MGHVQFSIGSGSGSAGPAWRAGRWALLAAAAVLALPIVLLAAAAVVVGAAVFLLSMAVSMLAALVRQGVDSLRGGDRDGRRNVRVISRQA